VDTFINATGWRPTRTLLLGGAFRATEYDYFQQQIVRLVTNPSGKANNELEGEFTDWSALEAFVDEFLVVAA
jgi:menaquinone-dependent protoporphyrinogen oxidase